MPPQENEQEPSATGSPPNSDTPGSPPASPNWAALKVSMKYLFIL